MYDPQVVEDGVRDFIAHKTGSLARSVAVTVEGCSYVIVVKQADPIPAAIVEQIKLMLPEGYALEVE